MLQYYLQEGEEGSTNLKNLYNELNKEYFSGGLPTIKLIWSGRLKRAVGQAVVSYIGIKKRKRNSRQNMYIDTIPVQDIELNMKSLKITMSKAFDMNLNDVKGVMLHEMVHIYLYAQKKVGGHHGTAEFDGWIKKLRDQSGLHVPLMESNFKKSPKVKAKEGYVLLVYGAGQDKFGVSSYSKNAIFKDWLKMAEVLTRMVGYSSKIIKLEMFKVSHPIVAMKGSKRSFKTLSWEWIDEVTAKEIKSKGKVFFVADKSGGWLEPKRVGIPISNINSNALLFDKKGQWTNANDVVKKKKDEKVSSKLSKRFKDSYTNVTY